MILQPPVANLWIYNTKLVESKHLYPYKCNTYEPDGMSAVNSSYQHVHASIKIVFEIGDPAGTSTVALFLKNKSIINSNSLRGNIHTEKSRNRKRLDGTC
jgi:hypothetical protein